MNTDDHHRQAEEERFAAEAGKRLRERAEGLDAATASRLNRARQQALAELDPDARRWQGAWGPALAAAAVAAVAVALWAGRGPGVNDPSSPAADEAALELEMMLADDSLELIEELEFYDWVETAAVAEAGRTG